MELKAILCVRRETKRGSMWAHLCLHVNNRRILATFVFSTFQVKKGEERERRTFSHQSLVWVYFIFFLKPLKLRDTRKIESGNLRLSFPLKGTKDWFKSSIRQHAGGDV